MSQERARNRAAREREAGIKAAARGDQRDRHERQQAAKKPAAKSQPKKGTKKPAKQSHPRTPANKRHPHAPVGRPDGPLARRRRFRVRLLVGLLVLVNVAAWLIWPDWAARLAVLILSVITAPLLAALLLRRR
ncbi:MAG TPA: hypothetical protein VK204_05495 [Nocardioidaceae bacterium]|nr:hypothetical protein [Nocardioidaceae bacterium]